MVRFAKTLVRRILGIKRPWDYLEFDKEIQRAIVRPGDVVYDIGANVGDWAAHLYPQLVGPHGRVFAFEPIPDHYLTLCRNCQVAGAGQVATFPFGVSDENSVRRMCFDPELPEMASLAKLTNGDWIECQFYTLDTIRSMFRLPVPDVLKIDVEGAEAFVFRGASETLKTGPVLFFEAFIPWQRALGIQLWDVLGPLQLLGYRFAFQCPSGLIDHDSTADSPCPSDYENGYNVLASLPKHRERLERLKAYRPGNVVPLMNKAPMLNR